MEEVKEILQNGMMLFMKYGIKSVTMDDLARELGKSKKTLYQHFENKDDLIYQGLNLQLNALKNEINKIRNGAGNAIDECLRIHHFNFEFLKELNPSVMFDLQKYHPRSWQLFELHKNEFIYNAVRENLQRGQEEGLYRLDFNPSVIAKYHIQKIELFTDPNLFLASHVNRMDAYLEIMRYHLHGVMSEDGRTYFQQQNQSIHAS